MGIIDQVTVGGTTYDLRDTPLTDYVREMSPLETVRGNPVKANHAAPMTPDALTVTIEPMQEGEGDPSPANVRPISGYMCARLKHVSKNLVNVADFTLVKSDTRSATKYFNAALPEATYTASFTYTSANCTKNVIVNFRSTEVFGSVTIPPTQTSGRFTVTYTGAADRLYAYISSNDVDDATCTISDIQIEAGDTATAYEPYDGNNYETWFTIGENHLANAKYQVNSNSVAIGQNAGTSSYLTHLDAGTYWLRVWLTDETKAAQLYYRKSDGEGTRIDVNNTDHYATFTLEESGDYVFWVYRSGITADEVVSFWLGSQFVYGGTLDVLAGTLTVDRAAVAIGDLTWTYYPQYVRFATQGLQTSIPEPESNSIPLAGLMCSSYTTRAATSTGSSPINNSIGVSTNKTMYLRDEAYTDVTTWLAAVGDQTIVYPLATPMTYTLTPTQVDMLRGTNTLVADCGQITLSYRQDIYSKLYAMITELQATVLENMGE